MMMQVDGEGGETACGATFSLTIPESEMANLGALVAELERVRAGS